MDTDLPEGTLLFIYHCMWRKKTRKGFNLKFAYGNLAALDQAQAEVSVREMAAGYHGPKHQLVSIAIHPVDLARPMSLSFPAV